MILDIDGIYIRNYTQNDVFAIAKYANNIKIAALLRDHFPHPYSLADAAKWIDTVSSHYPQTQFALATEEEAVGNIGVVMQHDVYRQSAEIGYWLGEHLWGKGIMTRVVSAFCDYAFDIFPLIRIFARVFETNFASARVLEKSGFSLEGRLCKSVFKNGSFLDELVYARIHNNNFG